MRDWLISYLILFTNKTEYSSINLSEDPELKENLVKGEINKVICPRHGCID